VSFKRLWWARFKDFLKARRELKERGEVGFASPPTTEDKEMAAAIQVIIRFLPWALKLDILKRYRTKIAAWVTIYLSVAVGGPQALGLLGVELPAAAGEFMAAINPIVTIIGGWAGVTGIALKNVAAMKLVKKG
jgi:hypothetical protein